jgi:hypothetical protein
MLGGIVFLLPVAAILVVIVKAGKMALDTVTPLAEKLPFSKGEAVLVVYVIAAIALVLLSFAAGVLVRSMRIESDAVSFLEDRIAVAACPLRPKSGQTGRRFTKSALSQQPIYAMQQKNDHSIASSARPSSVIGKVKPSAFAVFRLMISSSLASC